MSLIGKTFIFNFHLIIQMPGGEGKKKKVLLKETMKLPELQPITPPIDYGGARTTKIQVDYNQQEECFEVSDVVYSMLKTVQGVEEYTPLRDVLIIRGLRLAEELPEIHLKIQSWEHIMSGGMNPLDHISGCNCSHHSEILPGRQAAAVFQAERKLHFGLSTRDELVTQAAIEQLTSLGESTRIIDMLTSAFPDAPRQVIENNPIAHMRMLLRENTILE